MGNALLLGMGNGRSKRRPYGLGFKVAVEPIAAVVSEVEPGTLAGTQGDEATQQQL